MRPPSSKSRPLGVNARAATIQPTTAHGMQGPNRAFIVNHKIPNEPLLRFLYLCNLCTEPRKSSSSWRTSIRPCITTLCPASGTSSTRADGNSLVDWIGRLVCMVQGLGSF